MNEENQVLRAASEKAWEEMDCWVIKAMNRAPKEEYEEIIRIMSKIQDVEPQRKP